MMINRWRHNLYLLFWIENGISEKFSSLYTGTVIACGRAGIYIPICMIPVLFSIPSILPGNRKYFNTFNHRGAMGDGR